MSGQPYCEFGVAAADLRARSKFSKASLAIGILSLITRNGKEPLSTADY